MAPSDSPIQLPVMVVSRTDVSRLQRELELVSEFMSQTAIRQPGTSVKMPKTSRLLDEIVEINKFNLLQPKDRESLAVFLKQIYATSPVLHISFSADPSPTFTQKLMVWLRTEIHPTLLLQVGLQPNIGAGCIVRTNNKVFDLSLRQKFADNKSLLINRLTGAGV